jgi:hypothetical protein
MMNIIRAIGFITLSLAVGGCWGGVYENPAAEYVHRSDTVTLSAGNAKEVNAATHVIDPWPRQVGDRRIPADGGRMVNAIERYRSRQATRPAAQTGQPTGLSDIGVAPPSGATSGSGSSSTTRTE